MIFLDTYVLIYALAADHPAREPAVRIMDAVGEGRIPGTTTRDVIQEFVHVYSRRRSRSESVANALRYATMLAPLAVAGSQELEHGLHLFAQYEELGAADAVLAATARAHEARALVSADRAFSTVEGLPFVELGSADFDRLLA